jgi:hypothetical protein
MDKLKIQIFDKSFFSICGPSYGTGNTKKASNYIEYETFNPLNDYKISFFTDFCLEFVDITKNSKYKIALIMEPRALYPHIYSYISDPINYSKFDFVLTHDKTLLEINANKFKFIIANGHWIHDNDIKIHHKNKLMSIIASFKTELLGHKLRHEIINRYNTYFGDGIYGRNTYKTLENKIDGLKDYKFHVVIENNKQDYYFTEKLTDAIITGCIPIYYGCPSIDTFYDTRGILQFDNIEEFECILNNCVNDLYYEKIKKEGILERNFIKAQRYLYPEDYIYQHLLKDLI